MKMENDLDQLWESSDVERGMWDGPQATSHKAHGIFMLSRCQPARSNGPIRPGRLTKVTALVTVFAFVWSMCITPVMAETVNLEGGSVDVNIQDNTTNWNVQGNPVWNVPEFNVPQGSTYNIAGLGQGSSLALLVNGGNASNIFGTMNLSNLAFILQNIAGINIGATGLINLDRASLLASTLPLNLDATQFLAQDYQFNGKGGFLMNEGKIIGNHADLVALISNAIENRGVIDVPMGTVALATGSMVTVGISGDGFVSIGVDESTANDMGLSDQIRNTGTISADGGRVILSAKAMDGLFEKAISLEQDGSALSAVKANNGSVEFVSFDDFYNSGSLSATNGHILVDSKGNITNEGTVSALSGSVEMTAGQSVYNKNLIEALGGKVEITAKEGGVKNTGTIDATDGVLTVNAREDVMNEALMKVVNGEIKATSTEGAIINAGTLDAEKGSIELNAAGTIETTGSLKAETFRERGATFRLGGHYQVGVSYHDNLDGALKMIPTHTGTSLSGTITDAGDVIVEAGTAVTLTGHTTIIADDDVNGFGFFEMLSGSSIAGGGFNLSITAGDRTGGTATENRLGSISNIGILSLNASAGGTPTYLSDPTAAIWTGITDFRISSGKLNRFTGTGSLATPYVIYDVYGLQGMQGFRDSGIYFQLDDSIDASSTLGWNGGLGFDPVGSSTASTENAPTDPFMGTLNGRNFIITGLKINRPSENFVGLFGATKDATIKNLGLGGGSVVGGDNVGSLVGYNFNTSVADFYASTSVSGGNYVGGLVGLNSGWSIITNSYVSGDVAGTGDRAGGFAGRNYQATITNSFATGVVTGGGAYRGGFIGEDTSSIYANNWWWKETAEGGHNYGLLDTGNNGDISDTKIAVEDTLADFYSSAHPVYVSSTTEGWDFDVEWLTSAGDLPTFGINPNTYLWTGTGSWSDPMNWNKSAVPGEGDVAGFNGTSIANSNIDDAFGGTLARIRIKVDYTGTITQDRSLAITGNYIQEGGIFRSDPIAQPVFSATNFYLPGGKFNRFTGTGTSGDPYMIHDIYGLQGMKGFVASGTYLELANDINASPAERWNYKGSGDAGDSANYFGFDPIGNREGNFSGVFDGAFHKITGLAINRPGTSNVGLFGRANNGNVHNVGLVGGSVIGASSVGGLIGYNYQSVVANSYSTLNVTGTEWVGGLVGTNDKNSSITRSYATGNVTNTGNTRGAGGLVGYNYDLSAITNSYATGRVSGYTDVGGLVGANENMVASFTCLAYSYSTGQVLYRGLASYAGGLVGWFASGLATKNYWDTTTSGMSNSSGVEKLPDGVTVIPGYVEGKTTAQMQQMTTFSGWNPGIWGLKAGVSYPELSLYHTRWTGAGSDSNWSTPENWSNNIVPDANTLVFFNDIGSAKASTIDAGFSGSVGYLGIGSGYGSTIDSTITQNRTLTTGDFSQSEGNFIGGDSINLHGFVLQGGSFTAPTTLNLTGGWSKSGGTFLSNSGTVNINGTGSQWLTSGGSSFNVLTINRTGTLQLQDALTVADQLTVTSGTLDVNSKNLSQGGDWSFTNLLNVGNVTLTGDGKTITSGGTSFPLLTTLTISGNYSLVDAMTIRNALNVTGTLDAATLAMTFERNVNIANVTRVGATTASGLGYTITSSGQPFASLRISGTYTLSPSDPITVTGDLATQGTGTLNAAGNAITEGGNWLFTGLSGLGAVTLTGSGKTITTPDPLINQFNDLTISGTYALAGDVDITKNGIHINGTLSVPGGTLNANSRNMTVAGSFDLTNISNAGNVVLDGSSGVITPAGKSLTSLSISSGAYSLLGPLSVGSLGVAGSLNVMSNTITTWGGIDLTNISGIQTLLLTGTGSLTSGSRVIQDLSISGTYSLASALSVNGVLSFSGAGALDALSNTMTFAQSLDLTNITNARDVVLTGSGSITSSTGKEMRNLTIASGLGVYTLEDALHVNNALDVSGGKLDADGFAMTIAGDLDLANISNAASVTLDGTTGSLTLAGKQLSDLTILGAYGLKSTLHVNGALSVTGAGGLDVENNVMTLGGSLDLTNIDRVGDVTLDGSSGSIRSSGVEMNSLTLSGAYTLSDALYVKEELNIQAPGTLDALGKSISAGGNWSFDRLFNPGDVTLTGAGSISSSGSEFGNLTISGAYVLENALHVNGVLNVVEETGELDAAGKAITVAKNLYLTNIEGVQDVTLEGEGYFKSDGDILNSLTISGAYVLEDPVTVTQDLAITETGSLNAMEFAISEGGDWSFDRLLNRGDITLTGSSKTITTGGLPFRNLTISGGYTLAGALLVTSVLDVTETGTLDANFNSIELGCDLNLSNISNPWDVTLYGSGSLNSAEERELNNLTFMGTNSLGSAIFVNGVLDVVAGTGTLEARGNAITVAQSLDLTYISDAGDVTLTGSGSLISGGQALAGLTISGDYSLSDNAHVTGELTVTDTGALNANGKNMILGGSLDLTRIENYADLTLEGSGSIKSDGKEMTNLTISGSGVYTLDGALHVNGVFDVSAGNLDARYTDMTIAGDLDLTNILDPGNVTLDGSSGFINSADKAVRDLTILGNYSLRDALHVNGELTVTGTGLLHILGQSMTLAQSLDLTKIPDAQHVTLDGSGTITSGTNSIASLTIADTGSYTLRDALTVTGDLVLLGRGTLDAGSMAISESGNWASLGISNLGAVTLTGSGKTLTSSGISFGSLTVTTGTYTLSLSDPLTVTGELDIQGAGRLNASGNNISEGGNWSFDRLSNYGNVTLTGSGKTITSGTNTFSNLTVSGTYSLIDALRVSGALNVPAPGSLDVAGQAMTLAQDLNISGLSHAGDITLTGSGIITSGGNQFTSLTITGAYTLASSDPLTVTGDLDIQGSGTLNASGNTISEGGNWVFTNLSNYGAVTLTGSGKTITSGGNAFSDLRVSGDYSLVDALHVNGALNVTGTLNGEGKAMTLAHDLNLTKISNAGNVTLDGSGFITSGGRSVQDLTISGTYSLVDALTAAGNLSIPGTLDASEKDISVGGDWAFLGGLLNLANVTLTGSGKTITSGGNAFNDLTISGLYSLVDALHVNGALDVSSGTLNASSKAMTIGGDIDLSNITNAQGLTLDGSGSITSSGRQVSGLTITGAYTLADALSVSGALNMTGTLDAANQAMTLAESLDLTKISNARDVTLTGSGSINTAGQALNNLSVSGAYSQASDLSMNGDFSVLEGGSFTDASPLSHAFTVAGNFSVASGTNAFRRYTGSGTASDPFVVLTAYDLQGMKGNLASHFKLSGNLNMDSFSGWNDDAGFDPIGDATNAFTGSLDGNQKVISNLSLNRAGSDYQGLFGNIGSTGSVTNLGLEKVSVFGGNYVGGLAGLNAGGLSNVYTTGAHTVSGVNYVGGLVGSNTGLIGNAYSSSRVIGTGSVGGLAGANSGTIDKTYAMGWVTGTSNTGGLVGAGAGSVTNSYWDIDSTGRAARAGVTEGVGKTTSEMMLSRTYSGWSDMNTAGGTWVMAEGGTYPHFQFRYPSGVRGVSGDVYSAPGTLAGPGTLVSIYSIVEGSSSETLLEETMTDASSGYYVALSQTLVGDTDYVMSGSLSGTSRMIAEAGSIYPLYVIANQDLTLIHSGPTPNPTPVVITPVAEVPMMVLRSLVDAGDIPTPRPSLSPAPHVTIVDETEIPIAEAAFAPEANSLVEPSHSSVVTFEPPERPAVSSKLQNRTDNSSNNSAKLSIVTEPPAGHEPVPEVSESQSFGTNSSWRSEHGGREVTTDIRMSESGQGVEEITTDIRMDEGGVFSVESGEVNAFGGAPGVEEITTDIRMDEGGVSSFEAVGVNSSWRSEQRLGAQSQVLGS